MKVLAFAASNSRQSINKQLVGYAAGLLENAEVEILDINDYEMPLFSVDREAELGQPELAKQFVAKIAAADALVIAFAEHNGHYTAAYKNLFDWCSRIEKKLYQQKPMVMLSTSPGARGGATVLAAAVNSAPFFGGEVKGHLAVPSFNSCFDKEAQAITDAAMQQELVAVMSSLAA